MLRAHAVKLPGGDSWPVLAGGDGPVLVWLHGLRRAKADDPVLVRLMQNFHVVAPFAPGFVNPDDLDRLDDIHDVALAYDELIRALPGPVRCLVGHSLGGMFAAEIAAHFPDRAESLALLSPFGLWTDDAPVADVFAVPASELDDLIWADAQALASARARAEPADPGDAMIDTARDMRAAAKFLWPIPDRGLRKRLRRITRATLVMLGANDQVIPVQQAKTFAAHLPAAEIKIVEGAGHMLPFEQPGLVADLLLKLAAIK